MEPPKQTASVDAVMETSETFDGEKSLNSKSWDLDSVSAWLESLSTARNGESSREIYARLCRLNLEEMPAEKKFEIIEKFRPAVFFHSKQLKPLFIGTELPRDRRLRKIAKLSAQLHRELAAAYRQLATESAFFQDLAPHRQAVVLHRALQSLGLALLRSAQAYTPPSSQSWQEIKSAYQLAEKHGVASLPVTENLSLFNRQSTIAEATSRSVLFALANPYARTPDEIQALFAFLEKAAAQVSLEKSSVIGELEANFFFDLASPSAPQHISHKRGRSSERYLFCTPLVEELESLKQHGDSRLPASAVAAVLRQFGIPEDNSRIATTLQFLVPGYGKLMQALALERQRQRIAAHQQALPDWDPVDALELQPLDYERSIVSTNWQAKTPATANTELFRSCKICLSVEKGYGAMLELRTDEIGVGELAGLRDEKDLKVGIIRSLERLPNGGKRFGFEFVSGQVSLIQAQFESGLAVQALRVTPEPPGEAPSLILPAGKYPHEARLKENFFETEETVVLTRPLEVGPHFHRFEFVPA